MSFVDDIVALVATSKNALINSPAAWGRVPLGKVAKIVNGFPFQSDRFNRDKGYPVARIRDVVRGHTETFYDGPEELSALIEDGDLLVGMDGDFNSAPWGGGRALLNQRVCKVVPDESQLHAGFLRHLLPGYLQLINQNTPSTTVKHLSSRTLAAMPIPIPAMEIQARIAARIDELLFEVDDGEEELRRARDELETYRKSVLKAAVTGELTAGWRAANSTETGEKLLDRVLIDRRSRWEGDLKNRGKRYKEPVSPPSDLPKLPSNWIWASLDQLSWHSSYGTSQKCSLDGAGEAVLRIPNLKHGRIDLGDVKFSLVDLNLDPAEYAGPGDLLIVRTNGSEDLIGRAGIVTHEFERPTHYASYLIRFRILGSIDRWRWIRAFTESPLFRASVLSSIGSSAGQYNLSMSKLAAFPVALPPDEEIVQVLKQWQDAELELDPCLSAEASALRQSILATAFRGELVK